ncbi:hypothetical protein FKM82_015707 [Ascaphus truei]
MNQQRWVRSLWRAPKFGLLRYLPCCTCKTQSAAGSPRYSRKIKSDILGDLNPPESCPQWKSTYAEKLNRWPFYNHWSFRGCQLSPDQHIQ